MLCQGRLHSATLPFPYVNSLDPTRMQPVQAFFVSGYHPGYLFTFLLFMSNMGIVPVASEAASIDSNSEDKKQRKLNVEGLSWWTNCKPGKDTCCRLLAASL